MSECGTYMQCPVEENPTQLNNRVVGNRGNSCSVRVFATTSVYYYKCLRLQVFATTSGHDFPQCETASD